MTASTTDSTSHIAAVLVNAVVDDGYHVTATHWNYAATSSRRSTVFAKLGCVRRRTPPRCAAESPRATIKSR